ncbi:MAG: DUF1559 domain-containing protein, partial [FCB group bacterium]|nr:DUF1559 domain-containing protein [FCB group bacterium]
MFAESILEGKQGALAEICRNDRMPGAGMARLGVVLGLLGIALTVAAFVLLPSVDLARESAKRAACQNNLKSIGLCMKHYAEDNGGAFPDRWSALYPNYLDDPLYLVCPSSAQQGGDPARIDEWSQYTLVPGLRPTGTPADAEVLVSGDIEERHWGGRNELYLDG